MVRRFLCVQLLRTTDSFVLDSWKFVEESSFVSLTDKLLRACLLCFSWQSYAQPSITRPFRRRRRRLSFFAISQPLQDERRHDALDAIEQHRSTTLSRRLLTRTEQAFSPDVWRIREGLPNERSDDAFFERIVERWTVGREVLVEGRFDIAFRFRIFVFLLDFIFFFLFLSFVSSCVVMRRVRWRDCVCRSMRSFILLWIQIMLSLFSFSLSIPVLSSMCKHASSAVDRDSV